MTIKKATPRRQRIIEVATELFMTEGLYNVTLQQVAKLVGITQPGIYRHFSDMDDIILSSCQHWVSQSRALIRPEEERMKPANLQLKMYVERQFNYAYKNRSHDGLLLGLYYYSMRSEKMLKYYKEVKSAAVSYLMVVIKTGILEKTWKKHNPKEMAETLHSMIVGETIKILIEPKSASVKTVSKRVLGSMENLLISQP